MKAIDLITILQDNPDAEVLIQRKVTKEEQGFKHTVMEWVSLEPKQVNKPPFGGKQIFIG